MIWKWENTFPCIKGPRGLNYVIWQYKYLGYVLLLFVQKQWRGGNGKTREQGHALLSLMDKGYSIEM